MCFQVFREDSTKEDPIQIYVTETIEFLNPFVTNNVVDLLVINKTIRPICDFGIIYPRSFWAVDEPQPGFGGEIFPHGKFINLTDELVQPNNPRNLEYYAGVNPPDDPYAFIVKNILYYPRPLEDLLPFDLTKIDPCIRAKELSEDDEKELKNRWVLATIDHSVLDVHFPDGQAIECNQGALFRFLFRPRRIAKFDNDESMAQWSRLFSHILFGACKGERWIDFCSNCFAKAVYKCGITDCWSVERRFLEQLAEQGKQNVLRATILHRQLEQILKRSHVQVMGWDIRLVPEKFFTTKNDFQILQEISEASRHITFNFDPSDYASDYNKSSWRKERFTQNPKIISFGEKYFPNLTPDDVWFDLRFKTHSSYFLRFPKRGILGLFALTALLILLLVFANKIYREFETSSKIVSHVMNAIKSRFCSEAD